MGCVGPFAYGWFPQGTFCSMKGGVMMVSQSVHERGREREREQERLHHHFSFMQLPCAIGKTTCATDVHSFSLGPWLLIEDASDGGGAYRDEKESEGERGKGGTKGPKHMFPNSLHLGPF